MKPLTEFQEVKSSFTSSDGLQIFYRMRQADPERARLVIAHGLGEHSGRYVHLTQQLAQRGFSTWAFDLRGHGKSRGKRGHIQSFTQYLDDSARLIKQVRNNQPNGIPCFFLGHSLGGLIVLYFALRFPTLISGVVASSPALGMGVEVPILRKALAKIMSSLWPGLTQSNQLDPAKLSHDRDIARAYEDDDLVHDRASARWYTEFLAAMETVHREASQLKIPILLQVAGDDHLVDSDATGRFFEKLEVKDKTLLIYDGLYHEIYNELKEQREKVLCDLENWLADHLAGSAAPGLAKSRLL
jgi:alpha-beta hydrolase superfamily lysophospholipase